MSWNKRPEIMLHLEYDWYNELMAALKGNAMTGSFPEIAETAQRLMDNIEKYARFRVAADGTEFADIGFFKRDAVNLIWHLLMAYCIGKPDPFDAYHHLEEARALLQQKEESDINNRAIRAEE